MKELEEMKKSFDKFMAKAEQTLVRMKGTALKEILDKEEKEYLEAVIRPFKKKVLCIKRCQGGIDYEFIGIRYKTQSTATALPHYKNNTMYKGMELNKEYTLKELGLFEGE